MLTIAGWARRILAGLRVGPGEAGAIFPNYRSFERGERPSWWTSSWRSDSWGEVLGVYERHIDSPKGAIVVTERGMALASTDGPTWLLYSDVTAWDRLSKDPPSDTLVVRGVGGEQLVLGFARSGEAFAFVQFLGGAIDVYRRESRKATGG